jgi:hypothetical protein
MPFGWYTLTVPLTKAIANRNWVEALPLAFKVTFLMRDSLSVDGFGIWDFCSKPVMQAAFCSRKILN